MIGPIRRDLHISDTEMGRDRRPRLYAALHRSARCPPPGSPIVDRAALVATGAMFLWSLMTASCGLAQSFVTLFLARMGVGIGESGLAPASYSMLSDLFPKRNLPIALGLLNAAPFLGRRPSQYTRRRAGAAFRNRAAGDPSAHRRGEVVAVHLHSARLAGRADGLARTVSPSRSRRGAGAPSATAMSPHRWRRSWQFVSGRWKFLTLMFVAYICLSIQGWAPVLLGRRVPGARARRAARRRSA